MKAQPVSRAFVLETHASSGGMTLEACALTVRSNARVLIDALELTLRPGELLGILGANGAGKSSLLTILAGLAAPAQGQILLDGHALADLPPLLRAQAIALLPQRDDGGFLGNVEDFVRLGRHPFGDSRFDAAPHLQRWELAALAKRSLETLSGGERQRARLAQLAVQMPKIALLDEPLTHLDPAHQARLLTWARAEAEAGTAVAMSLHDPNWAACHCHRLLFLYGDGRWRVGAPADLLAPAALEALYGAGTAALWR